MQILGEAEGLAEVEVGNEREPRSAQYLWLYKAESSRDYLGLGRRPARLREDVTLSLRVLVIGTSAKEVSPARTRAHEIFEAAETVLREDIELGGTVEFHRIPSFTAEPQTLDERLGYHILFTIVGKTRI